MADNKQVKIVATFDSSQAIAEAKKLEAALKSVGSTVSGGGGGGGGSSAGGSGASLRDTFGKQMVGGIEAATKSASTFNAKLKEGAVFSDAHSKTVAKLAGEYQRLSGMKPVDASGAKELEKRLIGVTKQLRAASQNQQELNKYSQVHAQTVAKANAAAKARGEGSAVYSDHSQRQNEQLKGLGMQLLGGMLAGAKGFASSASSTFGSLNDKYRFDPNLTASQQNLTRANLGVGQSLSGYNALKNNIGAGIMGSPFGGALAMAGDLAPAAGGALQIAGLLKNLGAGAKVAGTVASDAAPVVGGLAKAGGAVASVAGPAALLGGAALAGAGVGVIVGTILSKITGGNKGLDNYTDPEKVGQRKAYEDLKNTKGSGKFLAGLSDKQIADAEDQSSKAAKLIDNLKRVNDNKDMSEGDKQTARKSFVEQMKKVFPDGGINANELTKEADSNNLLDQRKGYLAGATESYKARKNLDPDSAEYAIAKITNSKVFQREQQAKVNQVQDFQYDIAKSKFETTRNYNRQKEDFSQQGQRTEEDYGNTQKHFAIAHEKLDLSKSRAGEDYAKEIEQIQYSLFKTQRDVAIQSSRVQEDYQLSTSRLTEDSSRERLRLEQNTSKALVRLEQDTNKERTRGAEDYKRSSQQLTKNTQRGNADLDTGFQDSVMGILAPGLTSSKGFQLAKLARDYQKQKGRLAEDSTFERQGLDLSNKRRIEDINQTETRGKADISLEQSRGNEDINRNENRGLFDANKSLERSTQDLAKQLSDASHDAAISLRNAATNYSRTLQDISISEKEQALAENEAALQHVRALQDLAKAEGRAAEDYGSAMQGLTEQEKRFYRDAKQSLDAEKEKFMQDTGANQTEADKAFAGQQGALDAKGGSSGFSPASGGGNVGGFGGGGGSFGSGGNGGFGGNANPNTPSVGLPGAYNFTPKGGANGKPSNIPAPTDGRYAANGDWLPSGTLVSGLRFGGGKSTSFSGADIGGTNSSGTGNINKRLWQIGSNAIIKGGGGGGQGMPQLPSGYSMPSFGSGQGGGGGGSSTNNVQITVTVNGQRRADVENQLKPVVNTLTSMIGRAVL